MKVYAKCHEPKVDWLTDGQEYELTGAYSEIEVACDDGVRRVFLWGENDDARWERIERDDTPESVLKSCEHDTTAVWHDAEDRSDVTIRVGDDAVDVKWSRDFKGNAFSVPTPLLTAINEAVARHKAANAEQSTS